jgi:hypothetical protein
MKLFSVTPEDQCERNAESCQPGLQPAFAAFAAFAARSLAPVLRREIPDPPWPAETAAGPALAGSAT